MAVPCLFVGHRWRKIENEEGPCLYCSACGAEMQERDGGAEADGVSPPPRPAFVTRDAWVYSGMLLGRQISDRLNGLLDHFELGAWLQARDLRAGPGLDGRDRVHDATMSLVPHKHLLYLEFGVYKGTTLRYWASKLSDPTARFWGFDSFTGLPAAWRLDSPRGRFDLGGVSPQIEDPRVHIVPGRFEDTLPGLILPDHDNLIINVDCDIYSAARVVLLELEGYIKPGTLLCFDELNDSDNELRALEEFLDRTGFQLEVVARARNWAHWVFRVLDNPNRPG